MSRSVLVAGGAGYIGSHVCKALARRGYRPVALDDLSTGHAAAVRWGPLVEANIADEEAVRRAVAEFAPCGVMHFAAKSLVGESLVDPLKYYAENVGHGATFFRTLLGLGVDRILLSSTAAVYGDRAGAAALTEDCPTGPINPYGASKLALEEALQWGAAAAGGRWTILRYFNAAGADGDGEIGEDHEPETHLIPLVAGAALGHRPPVTVFGDDYPTPDGTAVRDYVHVEDLAEAHLLTFEAMLGGQTKQLFNVGGGAGRSVREVIAAATACLGVAPPHRIGPRRAGDPSVLVADVRRLSSLGWRPRRSLEQMVSTAAAWQAKTHSAG